jgi:hypothetical protein
LEAIDKEKELKEVRIELEEHRAEEAKRKGGTAVFATTRAEAKKGALAIFDNAWAMVLRITCSAN